MKKALTPEELEALFVRLDATCEDGGHTTRELCRLWKCGIAKASRRLQRADELGHLRHGRKKYKTVSGVWRTVECYWFEKSKRKK